MNRQYILSCESTVDLPYSYVSGRDIPVLFYSYTVDGVSYTDDMLRDPEALPRFYRFLSEGKLPNTSQINEFAYEEFFEDLVQRGDVLHIAFGSGMSNSVANAQKAAQLVRERHPERKLLVIDSLCSSSGYGMLVDYAADLRDGGASMEEVAQWVMENRNRVFSSRQIYESVWNDAAYGAENTVAVHIRHLREKLEIDPANPRVLKVVWGHGYKLSDEG